MVDTSSLNAGAALPALLLALGASILIVVEALLPKERKGRVFWSAVAGIVVSLAVTILTFNQTSTTAFFGAFRADGFTAVVNIAALLTALLSVFAARDYLQRAGIERGEYYPLLLMTAAGAMIMGSAGDLVIVLIGLELLSIPLYILVGFRRPDLRSEEGAMKYFLLGAFSSGFFVYGTALVYGAAGSTTLSTIFERVQIGTLTSPALLLLGTGLIFVSLGFKIAAVPFHLWTPDVYQGAPTPVTAYMSVAAKIGGFAALLRFFIIALPSFVVGTTAVEPGQMVIVPAAWQDLIVVIAAVTMIVGNVVALVQKDLKRMLAYSSIAHAGYILMAVAAAGSFQVVANEFGDTTVRFTLAQDALRGALVYLVAYAFTNVGAFAVAMTVERADGSGTEISNLAGLGAQHPILGGAMTIFMLSLTGIPLTAGFVGKWFIFAASINAGLTLLAVIGVITSVVSAAYYLRVIVTVWFESGEGTAFTPRTLVATISVCAIAVLGAGIVLPLLAGLVEGVTIVALK
ncbi:MAG TPA: NADH-quinone oxidoreductase subunit N [Aggregatilineales bacterium]|nr:NADH-quinone oxidoreductase subunit N [Anaerolineales bacterium]HRE48528.1 NADH-quinone oxidoreductase subunit N [Aggregatilineales bacterium]